MSKKTLARVVAAIGLTLVVGVGAWWVMREPDQIAVVSWGGEYQSAQTAAFFTPYTDEFGVVVHPALYGGGLAELARQAERPRPEWDVVDFELPDAAEACRRGLLEIVDRASLPAGDDGTLAIDDFVKGAIGPCWVGTVVYSSVIAFDTRRFPAHEPMRAADFFNLEAYPGGRGMKDTPRGNLEFALVADGVAPAQVYGALSTPEGVARAFAKLDTVRAAINWWRTNEEALAMLADGRVAMAVALNGPVLDAIRKEHRTLGIIWDAQRYELNVFGVVKGTPNKENAFDFVRFASGTRPLAQIAGLLPYGPARRSSVAHIAEGHPGEAGPRIAPLDRLRDAVARLSAGGSPTEHMGTAVFLDPDWWAVHGPAIEARWREWRAR